MSLGRSRGVPRSAIVLGGLLIVALAALLILRPGSGPTDLTLGGPLFELDFSRVDGLLVTKQGQQFRLDRHEGGVWALTGAVHDHVQQNAVIQLLSTLKVAQGTAILAGTSPEDRRFEFNGPDAVRLTLFAGQDEPITLALGTTNPVSHLFYASGAGREACFQVTAGIRQRLWKLPYDIQARNLLPGVTAEGLTGLTIRRGGRPTDLQQVEGRWWLAVPPEGPGAFGPVVTGYLSYYDDRLRRDDGRDWVLAHASQVRNLVYEISNTIVRRILPAVEGEPLMVSWGLAPPLREVELLGPGLNPDPTAPDPDRMSIAFGPFLGDDGVPVLRRGNVLLTDAEAIKTLEEPLASLANRLALNIRPLSADGFALVREGHLIVQGERTGTAATGEGREAWMTTVPAVGRESLTENNRHGFTRDLVVNLGRLPILMALPPTTDPAVLLDRERLSLTLTFGTDSSARRENFEIGWLNRDLFPASTFLGAGEPVGIWFPSTGKLLQVPDGIIVTARSLAALSTPN
jgi:hypothetical protein